MCPVGVGTAAAAQKLRRCVLVRRHLRALRDAAVRAVVAVAVVRGARHRPPRRHAAQRDTGR